MRGGGGGGAGGRRRRSGYRRRQRRRARPPMMGADRESRCLVVPDEKPLVFPACFQLFSK